MGGVCEVGVGDGDFLSLSPLQGAPSLPRVTFEVPHSDDEREIQLDTRQNVVDSNLRIPSSVRVRAPRGGVAEERITRMDPMNLPKKDTNEKR